VTDEDGNYFLVVDIINFQQLQNSNQIFYSGGFYGYITNGKFFPSKYNKSRNITINYITIENDKIAKKEIKTKETMTYLDEALEDLEKQELKKKQNKIRANFYKYIQDKPIIKGFHFNNLEQAKAFFKNSEWQEAVYHEDGSTDIVLKEYRKGLSTRHKSQDGLTHTEVPKFANQEFLLKSFPFTLTDEMKKILKLQEESEELNFSPQKTEKQGIKETINKTDYSEVNLGVLDLMADRFTANKHKYPVGNSLKPIDVKELCWALFRHVKKMIKEESNDPETFRDHLSAVLCNGSMILDQLEISPKNNKTEKTLTKL
jgi:hypothetical protein